jgi:hypothetical protein
MRGRARGRRGRRPRSSLGRAAGGGRPRRAPDTAAGGCRACQVKCCALSAAPSPLVISGDREGRVLLWQLNPPPAGAPHAGSAAGARGSGALPPPPPEPPARRWALEGGHPPGVGIKCCCFSGDGRFAATGAGDGSLAVWDVSGLEPRLAATSRAPPPPPPPEPDAAADGGSSGGSGEGGDSMVDDDAAAPAAGAATDAATGDGEGGGASEGGGEPGPLRLEPLSGDAVLCCCLSHDGSVLAAGARAGRVGVWSGPARALSRLPPCHAEGAKVRAAALAPDGAHLTTGGDDARVVLWDVRRAAPLLAAQEHLRPVRALAFSPDGRRVASSGDDCLIAVLDFALLTTYASLASPAVAGAPCVRAGAWLGREGRGRRGSDAGGFGGALGESGAIRALRSGGDDSSGGAPEPPRPHPLLRRLRVTDGERLVVCALGEAPAAPGALGVLGGRRAAGLEGPPEACEQPLLCLEQGGQVRARRPAAGLACVSVHTLP